MTDVVNDVIINYKSENLDQTVDGIKQTSVALDGLVVASSSTEKSIASLEGKFKSLERQFGTSSGQAAQFEKIATQVDRAVANNPALKDRGDDVKAAAAARYNVVLSDTAKAEGDLGKAHNTLSTQGMALAHAFRTGAEELALGVPITQVAAQQFSHLSYAATGPGGVVAAFKEVTGILGSGATYLAGLVTPAVAAASALGTFATVGIAAGVNWASAQTQVENALKGIGRQSGATVSDINGIAEATAKSTNLSIGSAREIATVFAATGKIGKDNIELATKATDGLAHSLGVDGADAAKLLAAALADPAKGLGELEAKTGAYSLKTQELVQSLVRQGEVEQAQTVLLQGMAEATKNAAEANGIFAASFKAVKDGFDLVGKDVTQGFQLARHDLGGAVPSTGVSKQDQFATAQADLGSFQQKLPGNLAANAGDPQAIQAIYDAYAKLTDQVEKLKAAAREEALAPFNRALKESATAADNAVNSYVPQIQKIKQTEDAIHALTKALQDQAIADTQANGGADIAALIAAQNQLKILQESQVAAASYNDYVRQIADSYVGVSTNAALQLSALNDSLKVAKATTDTQKLSAQHVKDYNDARRAGLTAEDASAIANAKSAISVAQAAKSALEWQQNMLGVGAAAEAALAAAQSTADAYQRAADAAVELANGTKAAANGQFGSASPNVAAGNYDGGNVPKGTQYTSSIVNFATLAIQQAQQGAPQGASAIADAALSAGKSIDAAILSVKQGGSISPLIKASGGDTTSTLQSLYDLKNSQTTDKTVQLANDQQFLTWLQGQPQTVANLQAISNLTSKMQALANSTNSLNSTMKEALSPYYTMDPRTSHIGFRSQGMATGGEITVPGGYSANDNMYAMIPVASGEQILQVRRPGESSGGSTTNVTIQNHIVVGDRADKNEIGRTVYQATQNAARQLRAGSQ